MESHVEQYFLEALYYTWSAAIIYALVEGLAGVKDTGVAFSRTLIAPRWEAAEVRQAEVTVKYPASDGYCHYRYRYEPEMKRLTIEFTGSGKDFDLHVLLPKGREAETARLDGRAVKADTRKVEQSSYAVIIGARAGTHRVELELA